MHWKLLRESFGVQRLSPEANTCSVPTMRYLLHTVMIFVLLICFGCKKSEEKTQTSPLQVQAKETPPEPSGELKKEQAKKTVHSPNLPAEKREATERTTPYDRKLPDNKTLCLLACNKAQSCGTAQGGVTACVAQCLDSVKAKEGTLADMAMGFRAQARCAHLPCGKFDLCVTKKLIGEKALANAPALAPNKATEVCLALCEQEKKCHQEEFEKRPGGMSSCRFTCRSILVNPEPDMAPQRAMMMRTHSCLNEDCEVFESCVRKPVKPSEKSP